MTVKISPEATAAREAARDNGRFGVQEHTAPELTLDIHQTLMAEGATRVMPLARTTHTMWFEEDHLEAAGEIATRMNVQGMVTRVPLPEGTADPAARYTVSLRSDLTGDTGRTFVYETGDQDFEAPTPTIAEALLEAGDRSNVEHGTVTEGGRTTVLDNLIAVVGEYNARDLLAHSYLKYGQLNSIS